MKEIVEQKNIIDENKVNMIVSASAGSGKTFVMIERIMKILTSKDKNVHADLDQMLILTFTNQSANEMSQRLEKKLMEESENDPELVSQLDLIRVSDISTIHAFCQKMLKKYFYEAKICAGFDLVSEEKQKLLFNKYVLRATSKFREENPQEFEELLQYFSTSRSDREVVGAVCQINSILENQTDKDAWIRDVATKLYEDAGEKEIKESFNHKICAFAALNKKIFENLINCAGEREALKTYLRKIYDFLDAIKNTQTFEQNQAALFASRMPSFRKKELDEYEIDALAKKDKFLAKLQKIKKSFRFFLNEDEKVFQERAKRIILNLLTIYEKSKRGYEEQKQKKNLLDFCDLEHKFLKLLENEKICQSISENYRYLFVDEFQDTNPVQMQILNKLKSSTIMTVGDIKQSIYGFRGATPEIFQNMMKNYQAGDGGVAKTLNCNFRSNKDVLNFANMIFSKIMTKSTSGVDYENEAKFVPFAHYVRSSSPSVEICITKKLKKQEGIVLDGVYDLTKDNSEDLSNQDLRNEARVVAQKILALKSQKIYDAKLGAFRDTNFSDIMILMRSRTNVDTLCEELIACGVPIVASSKSKLCSFGEISVLVSLIKLLVNRRDDIALASALSSFFCGLSVDELAKIRNDNGECSTFFECVQNHIQKNDEISQKLKTFFAWLDEFEEVFENEGLSKALHFAIFESGYFLWLSSLCAGAGKSERAKAFFDFVENNSSMGIGELLECCQSSEGPTAPNFSTGEQDFVGINTIHSSKGLEYPIVIMFECEHQMNSNRASKLNFHSNYGFALKYVDDEFKELDSPQAEFVLGKKREQALAEELRLLYVAMTRAKNTLVICGVCDFESVEKIVDDQDVFDKKSYLDLILGALDDNSISCIRFEQNSCVQNEENFYSVELFEGSGEIAQKHEQHTPVLSAGSTEIEKQLNDYINYNYLHKNSVNLSQKNSVSTLAFDQDLYASNNLSPKRFEREEHEVLGIAASDLGTLYHLVFEKIDFENNYDLIQIDEEIKNIVGECDAHLVCGEKVLKIVNKLRPYVSGKVFREKEFISKIKHKDIVFGGSDDDLVVQGKIDLLILGEKNYIFDYKITKINDEKKLLEKYQKQLALYRIAVEKAINKKIDGVFVVDVNRARILNCQNIE